jgi:hypothetical protein
MAVAAGLGSELLSASGHPAAVSATFAADWNSAIRRDRLRSTLLQRKNQAGRLAADRWASQRIDAILVDLPALD